MPSTTPEGDARDAWKSQLTEPSEMKLGTLLLQQKARDLRSKSRRERISAIVGAVAIAATSLSGAFVSDAPAARAVFVAAAVWVLIGQYFVHRGKRDAQPPEDAGLLTGLDSCRREVQRQLRLHRDTLAWLLGPTIAGLGAFVASIARKGPTLKMAPFLVLLACWAIGMVVIRMRQEREFRRALEELDQIERDSRA